VAKSQGRGLRLQDATGESSTLSRGGRCRLTQGENEKKLTAGGWLKRGDLGVEEKDREPKKSGRGRKLGLGDSFIQRPVLGLGRGE